MLPKELKGWPRRLILCRCQRMKRYQFGQNKTMSLDSKNLTRPTGNHTVIVHSSLDAKAIRAKKRLGVYRMYADKE